MILNIIFVVLQKDCLSISKKELHTLLEDKELNNIPILILGNKIDIKPHLDEKEIIEGLIHEKINYFCFVLFRP